MATNQTTQIACTIASNVTGDSEEFFQGCCGAITEDLTDEQIAGADLISIIIEAILAIIENCRDQETFERHRKQPGIFARVWFRRKGFPQSVYQYRGRLLKRNELSEASVLLGAGLPDAVANSVWEETKTPDFSVF